MKLTSVLVLAAFLGNGQAVQLRNTSRARQLSLAECEAAQKTTGQVLAGCENFLQIKSTADPTKPVQNMAQNMPKAPAAAAQATMAKAPVNAAAQKPVPTAQAMPTQGQALAATK